MFQVYCDGELIYHPEIENLRIEEAVVSLEVNKTGSFQFTMYPDHTYYSKIHKMKSILTVYNDDQMIFRGRMVNDEIGLYRDRKVECEGELAFLLDSVQRDYSFTGTVSGFLQGLIERHNEQVEAAKQFKMGRCTVENGSIVRSTSVYDSTWKNIEDKLINNEGATGYLLTRHEADGIYLDYLSDFESTCGQSIVLSENLINLAMKSSAADIVTAIIPLGASIESEGSSEGKKIDITSVNGGKDSIYKQEAVDRYGWITKMVSFDDITLPSNLLERAQAYLENAYSLSNSIEISALDLHLTEKEMESFHLAQYVHAVSPAHSINQRYPISKVTVDLLQPENNTLTLGFDYQSLTEQNVGGGAGGGIASKPTPVPPVDTGWKTIKLVNNCSAFDTDSTPVVRKLTNIVELKGAIKTAQANTGVIFGQIDSNYRPVSGSINVLCQGTGSTWLLTVGADGNLAASRYSGTMTGSERLDFQATYTV